MGRRQDDVNLGGDKTSASHHTTSILVLSSLLNLIRKFIFFVREFPGNAAARDHPAMLEWFLLEK